MINVTCEKCGNVLQIDEKYAGQAGKCNKCGLVPQVAPQQATNQAQPPSPRSQDREATPTFRNIAHPAKVPRLLQRRPHTLELIPRHLLCR